MQPTIADLKQVATLETAYSLAVAQLNLGGGRLLPPYMMTRRDGTFYKYDIRDFFQVPDDKRAEDGVAIEVKWRPTTDTFKVFDHASRFFINDIKEANADAPVKPSRTATARVAGRIKNNLEKAIAAKLTSTAVMTQNTTLSGPNQFSDYLNSDPRGVFATMRLAMKYVPYARNDMPGGRFIAGMAPEVFEVLRIHPDILAFLSLAENKVVSPEQLAMVMGVDEIVILDALYDSAAEVAASGTQTRVWGKDIVVAFVNPTQALETMTLGWTTCWGMPGTSGISADYPNGTPIRVRDYREDARGGGGFWREADCAYDLKIVMPEMGYLIKAAVA
jgi:hypothetical protein